jgi:putative transposase
LREGIRRHRVPVYGYGQHLLNCLCSVDLNMVRAGVVSHPQEWRWCEYDELAGSRQRYRLVKESQEAYNAFPAHKKLG